MNAITTKEELEALARYAWSGRGVVIGIDGFMGAGKTNLAFELAKQLSGIRIGLDSYIESGREAQNYIGRLRLADLSRDLKNFREKFDFTVIDGICLLDAIESIGAALDMFVYVKRICSKSGVWHDGFHLEDFEAGGESGSECTTSEFVYHAARRPHEISLFTYHRFEV